MAAKNTAGAAGQAAASSEVTDLRRVINELDGYSLNGFGQIEAIAKLTLLAMEVPAAHRFPDVFASALEVIRDLAMDVSNTINAEAEAVGCNSKKDASRRRIDARREFNRTGEV